MDYRQMAPGIKSLIGFISRIKHDDCIVVLVVLAVVVVDLSLHPAQIHFIMGRGYKKLGIKIGAVIIAGKDHILAALMGVNDVCLNHVVQA